MLSIVSTLKVVAILPAVLGLRMPSSEQSSNTITLPAECHSFVSDYEQLPVLSETTLMGESGGEWSPCTHLATYGLNFSPFFARFLTYQLAPKTVLEFGCGLGTTSDFIARHAKAQVVCLEPEKTLGALISSLRKDNAGEGELKQLALNIFADDSKARACTQAMGKHDLVFSLEVAEHIPFQFHSQLVKFLASRTKKWLVFSAASPKQGGTGHLDESMFTDEEWKAKFQDAGLEFMPKLTNMARDAAYPKRSYDLYANALVFKHPSHDGTDVDINQGHEMLTDFMYHGVENALANAQYPTWAEKAVVAHAFSEGVAAAMWPALSLMEQKVKKNASLCAHPSNSMKLMQTFSKPPMTSAWASFFSKKQF